MAESPNHQQTRLPLANLIIAGVNRSATTSLFTYLSEHPQICPSTIKETNYFLPVLMGGALEPIVTYAEYFKHYTNQKYRMEASPRYMFGGARIAETIYRCLGPVGIIFVLRDPVTRMVSYFHQRKRSGELPDTMSIDEYAQRGLEELSAILAVNNGKPIDVYRESIFARGLAQGFYVDYLEEWYRVFPHSIHISFFEDVSRNPKSVVEEVCRRLGLDTLVYESIEFTQENRTVKHKNVKRWIRDAYLRVNEERSKDTPLSQAVRAELERAYACRNQKLREMLCQRDYRNLPAWLTRSAED